MLLVLNVRDNSLCFLHLGILKIPKNEQQIAQILDRKEFAAKCAKPFGRLFLKIFLQQCKGSTL